MASLKRGQPAAVNPKPERFRGTARGGCEVG